MLGGFTIFILIIPLLLLFEIFDEMKEEWNKLDYELN